MYDVTSLKRVELATLLAQIEQDSFEAIYQVGSKARYPLRLLARCLPAAVADKKRRHARERARQEGYTPSKQHMTLLGWHILVSNLVEEWSIGDIFMLYGIRWQVELVFKGWKFYLALVPTGFLEANRVPFEFFAVLSSRCHFDCSWFF